MTLTQISIIILIQVLGFGVLILFRTLDKNNNDISKPFSDLQNFLQTQNQSLIETMLKNNDQLSKNFQALNESVLERLLANKAGITKDIYDFRDLLTKDLESRFEKMNLIIQDKLDRIDKKVQENLNEGFKKTNETFTGIIQRLAKIDEAQKKIESLSVNVVSLQDVLTDKKSRGIFGEVQLSNLLHSVFGEAGKHYYLQYKLPNTKIVDAALSLPEPIGLLCVDSKFPLENFKRMFEGDSEEDKKNYRREFVKNVKKHVDDIADKYILQDVTADQAIMFLPAEAIFAEIHAYHPEIIDYAQQRRVWVASPTTFMATLTTLQSVIMNMERSKYMSILHQHINKLGDEFKRYEERWTSFSKHLLTVTKDAEQINITTDKISKQFAKIMQVEVETSADAIDFSSQSADDLL